MLATTALIAYMVIAILVTGIIDSEGIDGISNMYDDTAITFGFALGIVWQSPFSLFSLSPLSSALGKHSIN
jgi:hypothetical protein